MPGEQQKPTTNRTSQRTTASPRRPASGNFHPLSPEKPPKSSRPAETRSFAALPASPEKGESSKPPAQPSHRQQADRPLNSHRPLSSQRSLARASSAPSTRPDNSSSSSKASSPFHHQQAPLRSHRESSRSSAASSSPFHVDVLRAGSRKVVPSIDAKGAALVERQRNAKRMIEEAIRLSKIPPTRKVKAEGGGLTHRMNEASKDARACNNWAEQLEVAVREGIDCSVADDVLMAGVQRMLELQQKADEDEKAARFAAEQRAVLAAAPIRTPRSNEWKVFGTPRVGTARGGAGGGGATGSNNRSPTKGEGVGKRTPREASATGAATAAAPSAAANTDGPPQRTARKNEASSSSQAVLLREGSLVQLQGLEGKWGISYHGYYDAPLGEYNGRKGRVSRDPPAWVIKVASEDDIKGGGVSVALVPVLLDSRSTDRDRGHGVWVAVPPDNLKVL